VKTIGATKYRISIPFESLTVSPEFFCSSSSSSHMYTPVSYSSVVLVLVLICIPPLSYSSVVLVLVLICIPPLSYSSVVLVLALTYIPPCHILL
jgi:hypothetical protein